MRRLFVTLQFIALALSGACTNGRVDWGSSAPDGGPSPVSISRPGNSPSNGIINLVEVAPGEVDPNFGGISLDPLSFTFAESHKINTFVESKGMMTFGFGELGNDSLSSGPNSVATDSLGRMVVIGNRGFAYASSEVVLARFLADGSRDESFGTDHGIFTLPNALIGNRKGLFLAETPTEHLMALLTEENYTNPQVIRILPDGKGIDVSYGSDGVTSFAAEFDTTRFVATRMGIHGDGTATVVGTWKVVARGFSDPVQVGDFVASFFRISADGKSVQLIDPMAQNPIVQETMFSSSEYITFLDLILGENNEVMLFGGRSASSFLYDSSGTEISSNAYRTHARIERVVPLPPGNGEGILAAGIDHNFPSRPFVIRLNKDGTLDPTFGIGGITQINSNLFRSLWTPPPQLFFRNVIVGVAADSTGNSFVLLNVFENTNRRYVGAIFKLKPSGQIDSTFGSNGDGIVFVPTPENTAVATPVGLILRDNHRLDVILHLTSTKTGALGYQRGCIVRIMTD